MYSSHPTLRRIKIFFIQGEKSQPYGYWVSKNHAKDFFDIFFCKRRNPVGRMGEWNPTPGSYGGRY